MNYPKWWPRKHVCYPPKVEIRDKGDLIRAMFGFECKYCGKWIGLDSWQLREMPWSMAKCSVGKPISIGEYIGLIFCFNFSRNDPENPEFSYGDVDCLGRGYYRNKKDKIKPPDNPIEHEAFVLSTMLDVSRGKPEDEPLH